MNGNQFPTSNSTEKMSVVIRINNEKNDHFQNDLKKISRMSSIKLTDIRFFFLNYTNFKYDIRISL